jgi:hypothetical protein
MKKGISAVSQPQLRHPPKTRVRHAASTVEFIAAGLPQYTGSVTLGGLVQLVALHHAGYVTLVELSTVCQGHLCAEGPTLGAHAPT